MSGSVILDASALLAVLKGEAGSEVVEPDLEGAVMSSVNWMEVVQKMLPFGVQHGDLRQSLPGLEIAAFLEPHAAVAAAMHEPTKHLGTSLADRACLALAAFRDATVLSADRQLAKAEVGVEIKLIR
ncbi:MAG: type II toxin-antitoxin system VapC family toxin [Solirubrobacterales bacterium]|nr:type II toxin-antitoxin system VapC family toxin [Solirubrobacterales bacterium]MCB0870567.1 type II toxin-antitoxin system VapC family toxin [Solirubrobacterales bacterium]